jgi:hypothetical protein
MQIRPALFIGLGSTGVRIINEFRRLMFEQFNMCGLPIFRYVGIETDLQCSFTAPDLPDDRGLKPFERIEPVRAGIHSKRSVDDALNPGNPNYIPDLSKWFDANRLTGNFNISAGAGHVRMVGRLALWMNWVQVADTLAACKADILDLNNKTVGQQMLQNKLNNNAITVAQSGYDLFLLGSLCGGTCGGMITDMAYQLKELFFVGRLHDNALHAPRFHAVLTILDHELSANPKYAANAANCWASLKELDYFMDAETVYDFTFPGRPTFTPTKDAMLSCVYLVSRHNNGHVAFGNAAEFNDAPLNKMASLRLFNIALMGLGSNIGATVVNQAVWAGIGLTDRNSELHTRTMASFGVSALWYPKFRIAELFGLQQAEAFCDGLLVHFNPARSATLDAMLNPFWQQTWTNALQAMAAPDRGVNVDLTVRQLLSGLNDAMKAIDLDKLQMTLNGFTGGNPLPLRDRLNKGGDLYRSLESMAQQTANDMAQQIDAWIRAKMDNVGDLAPGAADGGMRSFPEMQELLGRLKRSIGDALDAVGADNAPAFAFNPPRFTPEQLRRPEKDWWDITAKEYETKLDEYNQRRNQMVHQFKAQVTQHVARLKIAFLRPLLQQKVLKEVITARETLVRQRIAQITAIKQQLQALFQDSQTNSLAGAENILELTGPGGVEAIARTISGRFASLSAGERRVVIQQIKDGGDGTGGTWDAIFAGTPDKSALAVRTPFVKWALNNQALGAGGALDHMALQQYQDNSNRLQNLAKRCVPYVMMKVTRTVNPQFTALEPNYILAPLGDQALAVFQDNLVKLGVNVANMKTEKSPLANLVTFYREETPFYIDDLASEPDMNFHYGRLETPSATLHTHKDGARAFDKSWIIEFERVMTRFRLIQWLYPNELFGQEGAQWVFDCYDDAAKMTLPETVFHGGEFEPGAVFCRELSSPQRPTARAEFMAKTEDLLRNKGFTAVETQFKQLIGQWIAQNVDANERQRRRDAFTALFNLVFPKTDDAANPKVVPMTKTPGS